MPFFTDAILHWTDVANILLSYYRIMLHIRVTCYYRYYHAVEDEEYTPDGMPSPSQHGSRVRTYPSRKVLISKMNIM